MPTYHENELQMARLCDPTPHTDEETPTHPDASLAARGLASRPTGPRVRIPVHPPLPSRFHPTEADQHQRQTVQPDQARRSVGPWDCVLGRNPLLASYPQLLLPPATAQLRDCPNEGVRTYNPFCTDLFPVRLEHPGRGELEWRIWSVGSHHHLRVLAPRRIDCYLEADSVHNLLQAWHLCLLDSGTYWGCPWCTMAPQEQTMSAMSEMATHLWSAHPGQTEAALWTLAPPVRPRIATPEEQPLAIPWAADYLENRELPAQNPEIYHHTYPVQDQ